MWITEEKISTPSKKGGREDKNLEGNKDGVFLRGFQRDRTEQNWAE